MLRSNFLNWIFACVLAGLFVAISGCGQGDGLSRCVVSGSVSFDGKPVPNGTIRFVPANGPQAATTITDGKYEIAKKGGVPIGQSKVFISAYSQTGGNQDGDLVSQGGGRASNGADQQYIPKRYNIDSTLTADISGAENPLTVDFELTGPR